MAQKELVEIAKTLSDKDAIDDRGGRMREEETIYRIECRLRKAGAYALWTCYMSQTSSMPTDLDWWEQKIQGQREKNPHAEFRLLRIRKTTEVVA